MRPRPWRPGSAGSVPRFVAQMNRQARAARAHGDVLLDPGRPRRPGQLLERVRPGGARDRGPREPALRPDRRHADRRASKRRPSAPDHHPQHAPARGPERRRDQDRAHARRRLRAGRLGDPRRHAARLGGARRPERGGSRRRDRGPPRLRLLALQRLDGRSSAGRSWPIPSSTIATSTSAWSPSAASRSRPGRTSRWRRRSTRPTRSAARSRRASRLGSVVVRVDGRVAGRSPLVAAESVDAASSADKVLATVQNPAISVPLGGVRDSCRAVACDCVGGVPRTDPVAPPVAADPAPRRAERRKRDRSPQERTPEERRKMHEERMRRRRERERRDHA